MNKKLNNKISVITLAIVIFILPTMFYGYYINNTTETFYRIVEQDHQHCLERAKSDSVDPRWCYEIKNASVETFRSNNPVFDRLFPIVFLQIILFVCLISIVNLRKHIEELKEKLDG